MARNRRLKIIKDGKIISFKKLKAISKEELLAHAVAKKQLIDSGVFTYSKLKKLVAKKELNEIVFDKDIYFEKDAIRHYLKSRTDKKN